MSPKLAELVGVLGLDRQVSVSRIAVTPGGVCFDFILKVGHEIGVLSSGGT